MGEFVLLIDQITWRCRLSYISIKNPKRNKLLNFKEGMTDAKTSSHL